MKSSASIHHFQSLSYEGVMYRLTEVGIMRVLREGISMGLILLVFGLWKFDINQYHHKH